MTFSTQDYSPIIDNVTFGMPVPEPSTLAGSGTALLLVLGLAQRRRRAAA